MILLDENKGFYKANLHCHTTNSDGAASPQTIKDEYKKRGYSVVAFTDHEHLIDNSYLNDKDFLAITSCELAIKENESASTLTAHYMKCAHLNFYAMDPHNITTPCYSTVYDHFTKNIDPSLIKHNGEYQRIYSHKGISEMIKAGHEEGFLVSYNHPGWSLENASDYLGYEDVDFVEIRNHSCCVMGHHEDENAFADMLFAGKRVYCTATDDNHNRGGFDAPKTDSFGGFVMINAESLEYGAIMNALKKGEFYASAGPLIHSLSVTEGVVNIKCSPAKKVIVITRGRAYTVCHAESGEHITDISVKLREGFDGFRIKIVDENNLCAWSQFYNIST